MEDEAVLYSIGHDIRSCAAEKLLKLVKLGRRRPCCRVRVAPEGLTVSRPDTTLVSSAKVFWFWWCCESGHDVGVVCGKENILKVF